MRFFVPHYLVRPARVSAACSLPYSPHLGPSPGPPPAVLIPSALLGINQHSFSPPRHHSAFLQPSLASVLIHSALLGIIQQFLQPSLASVIPSALQLASFSSSFSPPVGISPHSVLSISPPSVIPLRLQSSFDPPSSASLIGFSPFFSLQSSASPVPKINMYTPHFPQPFPFLLRGPSNHPTEVFGIAFQ